MLGSRPFPPEFLDVFQRGIFSVFQENFGRFHALIPNRITKSLGSPRPHRFCNLRNHARNGRHRVPPTAALGILRAENATFSLKVHME
jgi:hypothetical protein